MSGSRATRVGAVTAATALFAALLTIASASPAAAATIMVTTTVDGVAGSLRAAFDEANTNPGPDTIELAAGGAYFLTVCGSGDTANKDGDLQHRQGNTLTVQGHGASIIQTCPYQRLIESDRAGGTLRLVDLTITGGSTGAEGGALKAADRIELDATTVAVNTGFTTVDAAEIQMTGSSVVNNEPNSAAVSAYDLVEVVSSTIADNWGSGISMGPYRLPGPAFDRAAEPLVVLRHATVVENGFAYSWAADLASYVGTLEATGSVVGTCGQAGAWGWGWYFSPEVVSHGYNASTADECELGAPTDLVVDDLGFGPISDPVDGPPAFEPLPESPLVDAVWDCPEDLVVDQWSRPRLQGAGCDIGAIEAAGRSPIVVTSSADGGAGSLRAAVDLANATTGADAIRLDPALGEYALDLCAGVEDANAAGDLDVLGADALTILGEGSTVRQSCAGDGVVEADSAPLELLAVNLRDGGARAGSILVGSASVVDAPGAAITGGPDVRVVGSLVEGSGVGVQGDPSSCTTGSVVVEHSRIRGNDLGVTGSDVLVRRSTISGNTNPGGSGGGILGLDRVLVENSTITGNSSTVEGGGIAVEDCQPGSALELQHATVVGNSAPSGANVAVDAGVEVDVVRSVLALPSGGGTDCDRVADLTDASFDSDGSCGLTDGDSLSAAGDPMLGALADNGGSTPTMLPLPSSPLLDAAFGCVGDPAPSGIAVVEDQRGVDRAQGAWCDLGAVEVEQGPTFTDVLDGYPFFHEIECLANLGVAEGYDDGTFRQALPMRRQAVAAWLWRLAGSPAPTGPPTFSDVPPDHPFADAIAWLEEAGLADGFDDGTFGPHRKITRAALASWLWRNEGSPPPLGPAPFDDVASDDPFVDAIGWLAETGIAAGYPDGSFGPYRQITRQATAAWFCRYEHATG